MTHHNPPLVVLNASNLHAGGGVQVAISFLQEAAAMPAAGLRLSVVASTPVAAGLSRLGVNRSVFERFEILDIRAWRGTAKLRKRLRGADAVFTIFGPLYLLPRPRLSVVGFAQAWIIYSDNEVYGRLSVLSRLKTRIHYFLKEQAFRLGTDFAFVEAEHVRQGLLARRLFAGECMAVVPNCVSDLYMHPEFWAKVDMPAGRAGFTLGIVSRDYLHKNLDMIPEVKAILSRDHGFDVDFVVTFNEREWARKPAAFRSAVLNAGSLDVEQCPSFYDQLDGVFFPSLLECFSATPLEATVMRKPLFASDRPFVRDFCKDFPWYFDPGSPVDAARVIAGFLRSDRDVARLEAARSHILSLPSARERAISYLAWVERLLTGAAQQRLDALSPMRSP
ncbi:glycosyltransferase [Shinella sp. S4-D37]|uniref:glycosyltransferase n=1 Tax=Shinella sp. S4-D37 TaxID=3161999 RepID=UPI003465565E